MSQPRRARRPEWVIGAVFLASGAALLVYIVAGMSLRWTFVALALAAVVVATVVLKRISPQRRQRIQRRMAVGAVAGFVATIGYDAARLALVEFAGLEMKPFEAWRLFGLALAETTNESTAILALGTAFHLLNGVAFGVAYTVTFGRKGILAGISWALVLETAMVSVYPGWLGLKALEEFLSVTITGHLVYGSLLGGLAKSLLGSSRWGEDDRDSSARGADRPAEQSTVADH